MVASETRLHAMARAADHRLGNANFAGTPVGRLKNQWYPCLIG
jgi:hypothetical protein